MRASAIVSFGILALVDSVLAMPSQPAHKTTIDRRQTDARGGNSPMFTRPSEWNDLPPLPPNLADAYIRNAQTDFLTFAASEITGNLAGNLVLAQNMLIHFMTYLMPPDRTTVINSCLRQVEEVNGQDASLRAMLELRFDSLDLHALEQEMAEIVDFRREHERPGSSGQEPWRDANMWEQSQPRGFLSPFRSLTESQDRQLIIAKARSGTFTPPQLLEYLMSQDPFLTGVEDDAESLISVVLRIYDFSSEATSGKQEWLLALFRRLFRLNDD